MKHTNTPEGRRVDPVAVRLEYVAALRHELRTLDSDIDAKYPHLPREARQRIKADSRSSLLGSIRHQLRLNAIELEGKYDF